jgi:hypothetical protein
MLLFPEVIASPASAPIRTLFIPVVVEAPVP